MALSKEDKEYCLTTAIQLAFKAAEGGGMEAGGQVAFTIEACYETLTKLKEIVKS